MEERRRRLLAIKRHKKSLIFYRLLALIVGNGAAAYSRNCHPQKVDLWKRDFIKKETKMIAAA